MTGPEVARKPTPSLARDDLRQRGLAEARRATKQHVIQRLAAAFGGVDEHPQVLARRLLADELVEALGPQRLVDVLGRPFRRGDAGGVRGHCIACDKLRADAQRVRLG